MKMSRKIFSTLVLSGLIAACVQIPPHDGLARVPLDHVVKLVKCDIMKTIALKLDEQQAVLRKGEINKFGFLTQWAAKVHLTVQVDDMFAVNPGATIIDPKAVAGTFFSLGAGAGLTTEAVRQEEVEFFLSFAEMGKEFARLHKIDGLAKYDYCKPADGLLLESDLGLKSIFDMALQPVAEGTLTRGNHPGLASSPPASVAAAQESLDNFTKALKAPAPTIANLDAFIAGHPANKSQFERILPVQPLEKAKEIASHVSEAAKIEEDAKNIIDNIVTPLFNVASSIVAKQCMSAGKKRPAITADKNNAVVSAALVSFEKVKVDQAQTPEDSKSALDKEKNYQQDNIQYATWLIDDMTNCLKNPPRQEVALYDPLDVISETINFYITSNGSVTPTWKLVRVSAPLNSTFLSGSRKDTNTIIISMGRPDAGGGPSQAMTNQMLSSLLGQAVQNTPIRLP